MKTLAALWALLLVPMLSAQGGPVLRVQTAGGQTTFHVGERIPLELSFTTAEEKRYEISLETSDRSGRERHEEFKVSPSGGWVDPLARYFAFGFAGGGMSGLGELSEKPTVVEVDLNQWVRFDEPGSYTVTVTSRRVVDLKKRRFDDSAAVTVLANPMTLKIVATTKEWQAKRLATILEELRTEPSTLGMPPPGRVAAVADLRYLASKAAVKMLAENLRDDRQEMMSQAALGLIELPEAMRESGLEAMNRQIDDATFPVSGWFLNAMAVMQMDGDAASETLFEERKRYGDEVWARVLAAVGRKEGKARAETLQTLIGAPPEHLSAESTRMLGSMMAASMLDLTDEKQAMQLDWNWDLLRSGSMSGSMLPKLQLLARLPLKNPGSNESNMYSRRELKGAALRRWYELDPEGAMQEILAEIGSAKPSLTAQTLYFLPKQALPLFEGIWAARFMESEDYQEEAVLGGLMVRFGTGAAASQVASKLNQKVGDWACEPEAASLGYLVKFDPDAARPLLERALHGKTGCKSSLFQWVPAYASGEVLTDAAVAALNGPDDQAVMDALIYLTGHGRKDDQPAIWQRYAEWTQMWAGKAEVLDSQDRDEVQKNYRAIGIGENLGSALIANQGWLADDALIAKVLKGCVGAQMCGQLKQLAETAKSRNVTLYRDPRSENYAVAQYGVKSMELLGEKLEQYPKGTVFEMIRSSPQSSDQKKLEDEGMEMFKKKGMVLEIAP